MRSNVCFTFFVVLPLSAGCLPEEEGSLTWGTPSSAKDGGAESYAQQNVHWGTASAPLTTPSDEGLVCEMCSVPDLLRCDAPIRGVCDEGDLLAFYVDMSGSAPWGGNRLGVSRQSVATKEWQVVGHPAIDHPASPKGQPALDPSVVYIDGRFLLFYYAPPADWNGEGDPAAASGEHGMYTASSLDGRHFTGGRRVLSLTGITDPDVVEYEGGLLLYYSLNYSNVGVAESAEAREAFTDLGRITGLNGGVPGSVVVGGEVLLTANHGGSVQSAVSTDGLAFTGGVGLGNGFQSGGIVVNPDDNSLIYAWAQEDPATD